MMIQKILLTILAVMFTTASANAATITSFTFFSSDSSGNRQSGQAWNTQGGDGVWVAGISLGSGLVNNPDTTINLGISGTENISLFTSQNPFFSQGNYFGLNIFFDGLTTPGISAIGQVGTSTLIANSSFSTWAFSGFGTVSGSGSLSYTGLGGEIVTLTSLNIPIPNLGFDMIGTGESLASLGPDGIAGDGVINIELSAVPIPGAIWLFGSALIGLVGFSKRKAAMLKAA